MEFSVLELAGSFAGGTGVLAVLMFFLMRHLINQMREDRAASEERLRSDRIFMEDRLTRIMDEYNRVCERHNQSLEKHTQATTELVILLKTKNGH